MLLIMKSNTLNHSFFGHRSNTLLIFISLVCIGTIVWIFVSIYASQNASALPPDVNEAATPLDPNLNTAILDKLDTKNIYSQEELDSFPIYIIKTDRFTRAQSVMLLEQ